MSIAIFSASMTSYNCPRQLKVYSVPFHVLPSTLPTPPPELPFLTHETKKGVLASLIQSLSFSSPKLESNAYHLICPELPTSNFSPASHATIPLTLRIIDRPIEPVDYFIRVSLVRRIYVRESTSNSMASAIEEEFGGGLGISPFTLGVPENVLMEPWCREEEEIVSRWGWVPYSSRKGADPNSECSIVLKDIELPLSGISNEAGWKWGYSATLDIDPCLPPTLNHGDSSWFSSAFRSRPPIAKEYAKHCHASSSFFIVVKVGISPTPLHEILHAVSSASPDLEVPRPNYFTSPMDGSNSLSRHSGAPLSNPFPSSASRLRKSSSSSSSASSPTASSSTGNRGGGNSTSPFNLLSPSFPGKMLKDLVLPITIGSVAEPGMECLVRNYGPAPSSSGTPASVAEEEADANARRIERRDREDRGEPREFEDFYADAGERWVCAPPTYEEGIKSVPAYA